MPVTTRKRARSDRQSVELQQQLSGPSSRRKNHPRASKGGDDVVSIWDRGVPVADLCGDTIDPNSIPTHLQLLGESLYMNTARVLGQSLSKRYSTHRAHFQQSEFRYKESLGGHKSCVNALAISRGQGRYLASGGDDKELHIRDLFVDLRDDAQAVPIAILQGHNSNIFSIDWSADNKYVFSTGNDSQVLYYDVEHSQMPIRGAVPSEPQLRSPLNSIGGHDESVPELSAHPSNPNLLLSCDDGGDLKLLDIRMPHDSVAAARSDVAAGFSSVQWNPSASDGNTFAAATSGRLTGSTRLYDVRSCFSGNSDRPLTSKDAVLNFHTALMQNSSTRGLIAAAAETNSLCFDPEGRFLASSISRYHPTIYGVNDPDPMVTLESTVVEDPVPDGYCEWLGVPVGTPSAPKKLSSCCTIKHGSFGFEGQTGRLSYAIGSDDFRAYVFEIPDRIELERQREFVNRREWIEETSQLHRSRQQQTQKVARKEFREDDDSDTDSVPEEQVDHESEIAYCAGSILRGTSIVRPARIKQQAHVLCGGRSIINTALMHPTMPLVFTSGITSDIQVHSAARLHAKDLYAEHSYDSRRDVEIGGTRSRMLLPPRLKFFIDESSSNEDDEDEEEEESDGDTSDEADQVDRRVVVDGVDDGVLEPAQTAAAIEQTDREEQPSATVEDFLASMRTDPLFSTGSSNTLDYQLDRHIGTYSLSHLSPGIMSDDSSSNASTSSGHSSAASQHGPRGGNSDDANTATTCSEGSEDFNDDDNDDDMIGLNPDLDDFDLIQYQYQNDGYGDSELPDEDYQEMLEDDLRHAFQAEEEFRYSHNGSTWAVARSLQASNREQKRMRLFDELLARDEKKSLTSEFRKVPKFAGGEGEGWRCGGCQGEIDTDQ